MFALLLILVIASLLILADVCRNKPPTLASKNKRINITQKEQ